MVIMNKFKDGVYDISNDEYHSCEAYSRSQLMMLDKSPYHFISNIANKKKSAPNPCLNLGSAFHCMLLQSEKFDDEFSILPKIDRRTAKGKEIYTSFLSEAEGKSILDYDAHAQVVLMCQEIHKNKLICKMLYEDSKMEQSIFWTDKETGIQFKCRPDVWSSRLIIDVKTISDSSENSIMRSSINYGYYLQAAMIFEAMQSIDKPIEVFINLFCEKEPPYLPLIYSMSKESIEFGLLQFNRLKRLLKKCVDDDKWDGYEIKELKVPFYAKKINEE